MRVDSRYLARSFCIPSYQNIQSNNRDLVFVDSRPLLLVLFGLFLALSNTSDGQKIDNLRHAAEKAMDFGKRVFTEHQKELREFRNKGYCIPLQAFSP